MKTNIDEYGLSYMSPFALTFNLKTFSHVHSQINLASELLRCCITVNNNNFLSVILMPELSELDINTVDFPRYDWPRSG